MFDLSRMLIWDIDTIKAFMASFGVLYKAETEEIKPNLSKIFKEILDRRIKVVSLCDKHYGDSEHAMAETELKINGGPFDMHAEVGTEEAEKISETLLEKDVVYIPTDLKIQDETLTNMINVCMQIIIEKQAICGFHDIKNLGGNPLIYKILKILNPQDIFVLGVYTEYCVLENVMPILAGGDINVWIILDAIVPYNINPHDGERAIKDMASLGARFIYTDGFMRLLKNNFG